MTQPESSRRPFANGDVIEILPEFQDDGDAEFTWVVVAGEEKGRVNISPIDIGLAIVPNYVVRVEQIKHKVE